MFSVQFHKKFKGPSFRGGWIKQLETFTKHLFFFHQTFSKKCIVEFSTILVCLLLSDSERDEIASSTFLNCNNSCHLYVEFSETINICQNV